MNPYNTHHVVYILTKLELGGAQKVCLALMAGMKDQGFSSSLISGSQGALLEQALHFDSVFLIDDFKREIGFRLFIKELKAFVKMVHILRTLKQKHPTLVVHTHSTKAGFFGRWAAFFAGIKTRVHTIHGFGFHEGQNAFAWWFIYLLELITVPITTHFICVSLADATTGKRLFPGFDKKHSIIRAAVDGSRFAGHKEQIQARINQVKTTFTIGTISCFKEQKNIFDLLQAFSIVHSLANAQDIDVRLAIIGDGEQRGVIEQWIAAHKLTNSIDLLGWQSNVAPIMRQWDLYAMSSLWEGLPCAIVEARLCRLPVVCYNVGGIAEVIIDGKNGFLIAPHNWQGLAEKINLVISQPDLLHSLSRFDDNLAAFDLQNMVAIHAHLYRQLLSKQ
ncbi:MAG: glycosyltransferase [Candidatus Babeliales bacterium]